jgi:hypothetical protein
VALAALGLSIYNVVVPPTGGTIGMRLHPCAPGVCALVQSGGPAALAGIRNGETIDYGATSLDARIAVSGLIPNRARPYTFPVLREGRGSSITVTAQPAATVSRVGFFIDLILGLIYVTFCLIVIVRAPPGRISALLSWLIAMIAVSNAIGDFQFTAPSTAASYFVGAVAQFPVLAAVQALLIGIVCGLPVGTPQLRRRITSAIPLFALLAYGDLPPLVLSVAWPVFFTPLLFNTLTWISILYYFTGATVLIRLARTAATEDRARVRWFISTIALWYAMPGIFALNDAYIHDAAIAIGTYYATNFALVGPVYATLRHQLVDLDFVLSRSAVYGIISIALVLMFLALEWLANTIADAQFVEGPRFEHAAHLIGFAAAITIGLAMRPLHANVERFVNGFFFRERIRKLHLLESFAVESDFIESREALLRLTFAAVRESLDTPDVAMYLSDHAVYLQQYSSKDDAPVRIDREDRLALQLHEHSASFVSEVETLHDWLVVPMRVRAETIGLIGCGRKPDRTTYLPDERHALESVAGRVATSYALLRDGTPLQ